MIFLCKNLFYSEFNADSDALGLVAGSQLLQGEISSFAFLLLGGKISYCCKKVF